MFRRFRRFTTTLLSTASLSAHPQHVFPFTTKYHGFILAAAIGLMGGTYVFAEKKTDSHHIASTIHPQYSFYKYVICGGGIAAQEALRVFAEEKHAGDVLLVSPEWNECANDTGPLTDKTVDVEPEYFHTKILKALGSSLSSMVLKAPKSAELVIGPRVIEINPVTRTITLDDGTNVSFEKCLIAVGASPPPIPVGKVVSHDASGLVGTAWSRSDWRNIHTVLHNGTINRDLLQTQGSDAEKSGRAHFTVVGGGWMSAVVGANLVDRGAYVTFSYADPSFLSRCLPKYLSRDIYARLMWLSNGGVDLLSYAALRYIIARKARPRLEHSNTPDETNLEAEVHVGTVFDAYLVVDFRTDYVVFAPTLPPASTIRVTTVTKQGGAFSANAELSIATDVYVAGACVATGPNTDEERKGEAPTLSRWSAERARATGKHAAYNMLGARQPFSPDVSAVTIDLSRIGLQLTVLGNVDGSLESFGYFVKGRGDSESTCGGRYERGVLFCVEAAPLRFRGAPMQLAVTGVALWDGASGNGSVNVESATERAVKLIHCGPQPRSNLETMMDAFATELGIEPYDDSKVVLDQGEDKAEVDGDVGKVKECGTEPREEAGRDTGRTGRRRKAQVVWRQHQSARIVPLRKDELMWVEDSWMGTVSPDKPVDQKTKALSDLFQKNARK